MGSVTIHLLVEKSLKEGGNSGLSAAKMITDANDFQFESVSHILSADSSLAELMDLVVPKLLNADTTTLSKNDKLQQLTILDLSYNPVKNISNICRDNTDTVGPKSKTLQSMNWYPSGKICFLPLPSTATITSTSASIKDIIEKGDELMLQKFLTWQSRNVVADEDFAYNDPNIIQNQHHHNSEKKKDDEGVQWTGVGADSTAATQQRLKPSEIFTAVSTRSDNDNDNEQHSKKPPAKKKRSEKQRSQRLDTLIQNLTAKSSSSSSSSSKDGGGKKKRVSDKVRTMLIKSRAEGNKKLRMEDRFHLELLQLIDNGEENDDFIKSNDETTTTTSYKFFSRVTTAGRVASSVAGTIGNRKSVEFLVSFPPGNTKDDTTNIKYRRLPNTMSLHDAQQAGFLQEFDVVVIRIFSIDRDDEFGQSKSVLDAESDVDSENNDEVDDDVVMQIESPSESSCAPMNKDTSSIEANEQDDDNRLQQRLHLIYQTASFDDNQKSSKKKKPVSKQVQAMLMKSKSTGNKGVKPNDRVHFDTVIFRDDGSEDRGACSSSFRFFSKRISVDELISTFQNEKDLQNVEIITSQSCSSSSLGCIYKKLTPSQATIEETVKLGLLVDFGRIIVRSTVSDSTGKLPSA
jgi:hypothetical protein